MKKLFLIPMILYLIILVSCSDNNTPTAQSPAIPIAKNKVDACVDAWIADFRKENGEDAIIGVDILDEVTKLCGEKKLCSATTSSASTCTGTRRILGADLVARHQHYGSLRDGPGA